MSTEPCEKHEMIGCILCKPKPAPATRPAPRGFVRGNPHQTIAEYEGTCTECHDDILIGDIIEPAEETRLLQGSPVTVNTGWRHKTCP